MMKEIEFYRAIYNKNHLSIPDDVIDYDVDFSNASNKAENEVYKLVNIYNTNSYINEDGVMLGSFNDALYIFDYRFDYFSKVLDKCIESKIDYLTEFVSFFICEYQFSLESDVYAKYSDYEKLKNSFYSFFERKLFYTNSLIKKSAVSFIYKSFNYADKVTTYLFNLLMPILIHLDKEEGQNCVNKYLTENHLVLSCFKYDKKIEDNKERYNSFISDFNESVGSYRFDAMINIFVYLDTKELLEKSTARAIINKIVDATNELSKDDSHFLKQIGSFDAVINTINILKRSAKKCYITYGEKLNECLYKCLYLKRFLLKNTDIDSQMHKFKYEFEIKEKTKEEIKEDFKNDFFLLYKYLGFDFTREMKNSIESFKNYPVHMLFNNVYIDQNTGMYAKQNDLETNVFKDYYEQIGNKIYNTYDDKTNICHMVGKFYDYLIKYLNDNKTFNGEYVYLILKEDRIKDRLLDFCRKKIIIYEGVKSDNPYLINLLLINSINELLKMHSKKTGIILKESEEEKFLEDLFSYYLNSTQKAKETVLNGIMNVYYIVYSNYGLDLRNDYVHGNKIGRNEMFYIDMMYLVAANIFLGYSYENY